MPVLSTLPATDAVEVESGSFRDRNARVFYRDGRVFRGLNKSALEQWRALSTTRFFGSLQGAGAIVRTELADPASIQPSELGSWAGLLTHETIPFVSYPYEWPFEMLKDAALQQLAILQAALDEDFILKDASAFNTQWKGTQPVFIDVASFERLTPGEPWVGYRQFCQLFLYPLMLQAYKGIPFQPWLRGSIDGIQPEHCNRVMALRDLLRPGVFAHVFLQARLQASFAGTRSNLKSELRAGGFHKELIRSNLGGMARLVRGLARRDGRSQWSEYANQNSYTEEDRVAKVGFVREVVSRHSWGLVWDLGCNTGAYSRIASENAKCVVAMDADELAVDRLYRSLKMEGQASILPLHVNLSDPSPNLGWRGLERKALPERGRPELTLCLALIHHVVITANIPLREFVDWLAGLRTSLIIEFPTKEDPMVRQVLRNKRDDYADYALEGFEECLGQAFSIKRRCALASGTRILYFATPRLG